MQVFKLNSSYLPSDTIKQFNTLIWTERYGASGDFKLTAEEDIAIMTLLPLGTLISHNDTYEVMIVEDHEIKRGSDKKLEVTVTGRSFDTFAENRPTLGTRDPLYDSITGDAINEVRTGAAEDVAAALLESRLGPTATVVADRIPNISIYTDIRDPDSSLEHVIRRSTLYEAVRSLLNICGAGIKTIRPHAAQTTLDLVIYDGFDLHNLVTFYAQYADLDEATYLWSNQGYKNYVDVDAHDYYRLYRHRDLSVDLTGLSRRVTYVEANEIEGDYSPGTATDVISALGQAILDAAKQIQLVQAKISETAKPKFKLDYDIGDLVTVFGEFSAAQVMRVTEHILTFDETGMRGYPSLSII